MQRESGENGGLVFRWDSVGEGLSIGSAGTGPSTHILPKNQAWTGQILGWGGGGQEQKCEMQGRAGQGGVKQHRNGNFVRQKIT